MFEHQPIWSGEPFGMLLIHMARVTMQDSAGVSNVRLTIALFSVPQSDETVGVCMCVCIWRRMLQLQEVLVGVTYFTLETHKYDLFCLAVILCVS